MSQLVPETPGINNPAQVDLVKLSREEVALLAPAAVEKQIDLAFETSQKIPTFSGNPTAISILIRNLVDNAIRYCKDNGQVTVKVYQDPSNIVLEISDNGPGIPNEFQSRVFERFFRVLGNKSPGSGLGLAIVQQISALHNAHVVLESPQEGTGLIVKVFFPLISKNLQRLSN